MQLKKILVFLLLTSVFACQQQSDTVTQAPPAASITADSTANSAKPIALRISPIISGYWLSAQYWKTLERTRSPVEAFDHLLNGPSSIYIKPFLAQVDSVEIDVSYNFHEGGSKTILLRLGRNDKILPLRPQLGDENKTVSELSYQVSATDTILFLTKRDTRTNRIIDKISYYRTLKPGVKTDLNDGANWGINKLLIAGQYRGVDSIGQPVNTHFLPDGRVTGLPFSQYTILTDFITPNSGDEILFDTYSDHQCLFGASFGRDTLRLYTILHTVGVAPGETDTTELFSRGRLRYQLVRARKP